MKKDFSEIRRVEEERGTGSSILWRVADLFKRPRISWSTQGGPKKAKTEGNEGVQ